MKKIAIVAVAVAALGFTGCGNDSTLEKGDNGGTTDPGDGNGNAGGGETGGETGGEPGAGGGESNCTVTHFTSGDESRFRVQGVEGSDCVKCPGAADIVKLTYTGTGFLQELVFDGSQTNGAGAASDELILEQVGNVCWSEDYDANADLPSASALTVDGHAATIEFDKGPDAAGPTGTLSYYRNNVLQFAIPVTEGGELLAYPDDAVQLK